MNFFKKLFYLIFGSKREPTDFEKLEFAMGRMKYAYSDPAFRSVYDFQQDFLPKKFYLLGHKLIEIIRNNAFFELVDEFNSEGYCLSLSKENSTVKIYEYSNDSVIIHINIPDLSNLKNVDVNAPLCNSIFLCFDLNDANNNYYYTAERSEYLGGSNYMLCGLDSSHTHLNFGANSKDGTPFMNDVTIDEVEIRFGAKQEIDGVTPSGSETNNLQFDTTKFEELHKQIKKSSSIPREQQQAQQEYVDKIVELLEKLEIDKVGVRFYINSITWENNSKELPSQDYVDLWDAQGITDMSSFGKKIMKALGEKYNSKVISAAPDLTKLDLVTRE